MDLQQLPADAFKIICSFLPGFDLVALSHINSWMLRFLSDASLWQHRVAGPATGHAIDQAWKCQYLKARSLAFSGRGTDDQEEESDSYVSITDVVPGLRRWDYRIALENLQRFSFDVWFSLFPATDSKWLGGIIYGQQSASRGSRYWPNYHQQFVIVSSTGDLYCSILDEKPLVASSLETNRWYHLALTYDIDLERQDVYLDGVKVRSDEGGLHREWRQLSEAQVGTGCITAGAGHFPRPGSIGWYGFNGVIDDFRVWEGVLSEQDVTALSRCGKLLESRLLGSIRSDISGMQATNSRSPWFNVSRIICTRPAEGALIQPQTKQ